MKQRYTILTALFSLFLALSAQAQYTFTSTTLGPYVQNFNGMGNGNVTFGSGTNSGLLPGIIVGYNAGGSFAGVPSPIVANDGSATGSAAYNFGTAGAADRALGGIAGGLNGNSGTGYICVRLRNTSGVTIKNLDIRYAIEQWYNSSLALDAYFRASYRKYSTTTGFANNDLVQDNGVNGWTAVPELDLQAPATGGIVGQSDGNSTTYRRTAQHRLPVSLANNTEIVIRFVYPFNSTTNGNGISIDDIVIYPETNVLYSKTTGLLNNTATDGTATWGQNADGGSPPTTPIDFTAANYTYIVQGSANTTSRMTGGWNVSGTNSRVVVGTDGAPAALTLTAADALTGTVDVSSGSTLRLENAPAGLTLGALDAGSTVQYASAAATQSVLPATYANLEMSNLSNKDLAGAVVVTQSLTLTNGTNNRQTIRLGNNNLTMLRGATLTRANGGQVQTNGTGEYRATVVGAGTSSVPVLFPVASAAAIANYLPVSITAGVNSAGNDKDETYRVRVIDGIYTTYTAAGVGSTPITSNTGNVNTTWLISRETATPVSATLKMGWDTGRQGAGFTQANAFIDHYTVGTGWDKVRKDMGTVSNGTATQWAAQRTGVSSFSPFAVTSNAAGPLPVELVKFDAKRTKTTVTCTWATASEKNNARFVVERSANGETFAAIGTVEGSGSSTGAHSYSFVDARPLAGTAYYRLRQVDKDGTAAYSPVVTVEGAAAAEPTAISAVPNPSNGQFAVWATLAAPTTLQGTVLNVLGEKVLTINEQLPAGPARLALDLSAQPAGIYVVQLRGLDSPVTLRVMKQ
ncbi:T9SS type A sorting domain-containing protein [Hymenobacter ruricola]|uniref:T9SS type A sorting domain-containing protein n=1 Tax=Hymenobacter ruricola TaxID=2791023 RepID=A0ABS0I7C9_9BACT|nr:T9SS type A sorting domain-containing protein [Hymenobacter ruricola]MBF9222880.1 T9SS type A sorting domain-containing protein [Hymenobacter ruricola]